MSNDVNTKPVGITELVLRDGHQSLFATRMRIDDMLPIAEKLDKVGYWSTESWAVPRLMRASVFWVKTLGIELEKSVKQCLIRLSRCFLEHRIY